MTNVKFLTGTQTNLLKTNSDGSYVNPIVEGSLYVTAEKVGSEWVSQLYYDSNGQRMRVGGVSDRAAFDSMNQSIVGTYIQRITMEGSKYADTDGATLTYIKGDNSEVTILLPLASETKAGTVNTGIQTFAGNKTFKGQVILQGGTDTAGNSSNSGALIIGDPAAAHISLDANEIQAKVNGGTVAQLHINNDGGITQFGGIIQPKSNNVLDLGTEKLRWKTIWGDTVNATTFNGALNGNVTGNLTGNATSADKWFVARSITLGEDMQGSVFIDGSQNVTLNAMSYSVNCSSGNQSNYPWHRIATVNPITGSHQDKEMIIAIRHAYNGGGYGVAKVSLRTNSITSNQVADANIKWLYRYNINADVLQLGLRNTSGNAQADLYYKVGQWARCKIYQLQGSRSWTLITSSEIDNTTTTDKKTSVEVYKTISEADTELGRGYTSTIVATDGAIVQTSNYAKTADGAITDNENHQIVKHYLSNIDFDGITNKNTKVVANIYDGSGKLKATVDFPSASDTQAGAITTGEQTFTGTKIIDENGAFNFKKNNGFIYSGISKTTNAGPRNIWFSNLNTIGTPILSDKFQYDPGATDNWANIVANSTDKTNSAYGKLIVDVLQGIAARAYGDDRGQQISKKYIASMSFDGTSNKDSKVTMTYNDGTGAEIETIDVPTASASSAGIITTGTQTLTGAKTIDGNGSLTIQKSSGLNYSGIETATGANARHVWFSHANNKGTPVVNDKFKFNPSATDTWAALVSSVTDKTNAAYSKLIVDVLQGMAVRAYADDRGQQIAKKYISNMEFSGTGSTVTLTYRDGDGADIGTTDIPVASASAAGIITNATQTIAGSKTFTGRIYVKNGSDASVSSADCGALVIGDKTAEHIIIDSNEIMAKSNGTTSRQLLFQWDGGDIGFGGCLLPKANNTLDIGSSSNRWKEILGYVFNAGTKFITPSGFFCADNDGRLYASRAVGFGVAADTTDTYILKVTGNSLFNGILYFANATTYYINNSGTANLNELTTNNTTHFKKGIRIGDSATGDTNYICFYGTTGDGPGSFNHTYIGENQYDTTIEASELLLFKGNDMGSGTQATTATSTGPDRIRMVAAGHLFQTYETAVSGGWTTICDSTVPKTRFEIFRDGTRTHGTAYFASGSTYYINNSGHTFLPIVSVGGAANIGYNLYVQGTTLHNGNVYFANAQNYYIDNNADTRLRYAVIGGTSLSPSSTYPLQVIGHIATSGDLRFTSSGTSIQWDQGNYRQRILNTDDSTANTDVFNFQQSSDSGSTWRDLLRIQDDGVLIVTDNTGQFRKNYASASDIPAILIGSNNKDVTIWRIYSSDATYANTGKFGYSLKYRGANGGVSNYLTLYADNQSNANQNIAYTINQNGEMGIRTDAVEGYALYVNGKVKIAQGEDATNGTTGALQITGGVSVAGASWFGGAIDVGGAATFRGNIIMPNDTIIQWSRNTDSAKIGFANTSDGDADSFMYFHTADNGNEYFKFRITSGSTITDVLNIRKDSATFVGQVTATQFNGPLNGNAASATRLRSLGENNNLLIPSADAGTSGAAGLTPTAGLALYEYYNASSTGAPSNYGNLLTIRGNRPGATQIALPWGGITNTAPYIRTHSDWNNTHTWSEWKQLCYTDGTSAYGTWNISITGSAGTLTTARNITLGEDMQGSVSFNGSGNVTLNAKSYSVSCNGGNKANYPWHRIATVGPISGNYTDKEMIIAIRHTYNDGGYGVAKVALRTNNASNGDTASASIKWLYRYNISADALQIGLRNTAANAQADLYYRVSTYPRCIVYQLQGSRSWTLITSNEVNDTTTTDKLTSVEVYTSVADGGTKLSRNYTNTIAAADSATVNYSNVTGRWNTARTFTIGNTGKSVNGAANVSWNLTEIGAIPSNILTATLTTSAGATYYVVNDTSDTVTLATGKVILVQVDATASSSAQIYINYNNSGYKAAYDSKNSNLTYYKFRAGWRVCLRYDGSVWRALYTPDSQWPLSVNKTTSASKYYFIGNTATGNVGTNTCYSCNNIYFIPSTGSIVAKTLERVGSSVSWVQGRSNALVKITSYSGYNAIYSMKTTNGDWSCGVHSSDRLYWTYITDTNFNSNTNTATAQMYLTSAGYLYAPRIYKAVWNDYAEFRQAKTEEPGRVVIEGKFGIMELSTKRLQPGGNIISDTYGDAMGQTEKCKTPIAVAGRVLAYTYEDKEIYELGDAVCTGPNGTVSKMTREEIREWPDRIIGTVSEIPTYETWGQENIKVNGRIWIKVK